MKNKQKKEKRYIIIEFDGTTTRACTFRSPDRIIISNAKGLHESQAKLHPDDEYDQIEGIRVALNRLGFDMYDNPFMPILKALRIVSDVFGDKDDE